MYKHTMKTPIKFVLHILLIALSCCSPLKLYDGPELPEDKVAILSKELLQFGISASVDGESFWLRNVAVLPGTHTLRTKQEVTLSISDCLDRTEFDSYGYDKCLRDKDKSCSVYDYQTTKRNCLFAYSTCTCEANALLEAGGKYILKKVGGENYVVPLANNIVFEEADTKKQIYLNECAEGEQRTAREDCSYCP